jgi:hypothetical protein
MQYNKRREELHRLQEKHPELAARLARKVRQQVMQVLLFQCLSPQQQQLHLKAMALWHQLLPSGLQAAAVFAKFVQTATAVDYMQVMPAQVSTQTHRHSQAGA